MASYWVIVRRDAPDVLTVLSDSLGTSEAFRVTQDRRVTKRRVKVERRQVQNRWPRDSVVTVERMSDAFDY